MAKKPMGSRVALTKRGAVKKRKGMKCIATFKKGNEVVATTVFRDKLIVATKNGVYSYPIKGRFVKAQII